MKCNILKIGIVLIFILWLVVTRYVLDTLTPNFQKIVKLQNKVHSLHHENEVKQNNVKISSSNVLPISISSTSKWSSPSTNIPSTPVNCKTSKFKCSYDIHIFYYGWYGNPTYDKKWLHWNHPRLPHWNKETAKRFSQKRHVPENNDVGSIYYPSLGFYSSHDPSIIEDHMKQIQRAGAGVLVISWYMDLC